MIWRGVLLLLSAGLIGVGTCYDGIRPVMIVASIVWIVVAFLFLVNWRLEKERKG